MAGAAGMLAAGAVPVVIRAGIAAINAAIPLDTLTHLNDAHAVTTRAFHSINGHAHNVAPASLLIPSL